MKLATTIISAAALAATATTATLAADDDYKFDGAYGGIEAVFDWTKLSTDVDTSKSVTVGGVLGFRRQTDSGFVMGLEGTFRDNGYENETTGLKGKFEWSAGLTLGTAFGDDASNLIYGKAAFVRTKFDPSEASGDAFNDSGWRFGGGYERSLSENMSFRLGGDYTTYGDGNDGWQATTGLLVKF